MPVQRIVKLQPFWIDHFTGPVRSEKLMLQEELSGAFDRLPAVGVVRHPVILDETPEGRQAFVEGRVAGAFCLVAIPAAIRPLPLKE